MCVYIYSLRVLLCCRQRTTLNCASRATNSYPTISIRSISYLTRFTHRCNQSAESSVPHVSDLFAFRRLMLVGYTLIRSAASRITGNLTRMLAMVSITHTHTHTHTHACRDALRIKEHIHNTHTHTHTHTHTCTHITHKHTHTHTSKQTYTSAHTHTHTHIQTHTHSHTNNYGTLMHTKNIPIYHNKVQTAK